MKISFKSVTEGHPIPKKGGGFMLLSFTDVVLIQAILKIKAYIIKERVSGYAGKVQDGAGYQFYIPEGVSLSDVLEEVVL